MGYFPLEGWLTRGKTKKKISCVASGPTTFGYPRIKNNQAKQTGKTLPKRSVSAKYDTIHCKRRRPFTWKIQRGEVPAASPTRRMASSPFIVIFFFFFLFFFFFFFFFFSRGDFGTAHACKNAQHNLAGGPAEMVSISKSNFPHFFFFIIIIPQFRRF
jgi:hypothetical protein